MDFLICCDFQAEDLAHNKNCSALYTKMASISEQETEAPSSQNFKPEVTEVPREGMANLWHMNRFFLAHIIHGCANFLKISFA
jgi:hypothetical protein